MAHGEYGEPEDDGVEGTGDVERGDDAQRSAGQQQRIERGPQRSRRTGQVGQAFAGQHVSGDSQVLQCVAGQSYAVDDLPRQHQDDAERRQGGQQQREVVDAKARAPPDCRPFIDHTFPGFP